MTLTVDELLDLIGQCGIVAPDDVHAALAELSARDCPTDGPEVVAELLRQHKLTDHQAAALLDRNLNELVLGNYVLLALIGEGGMGRVFKALHRRMERLVALKLLHKRALQSEEAVQRFHREARAAARLMHPNIVTAYDADEHDGIHYLAMEFVDGTDLARLARKAPLSVSTAVDCVLQAARGLQFAHEEGIIHRDIKPANLLMDRRGVVKILDMGIARMASTAPEGEDPKTQAELTQAGVIMGTVDFMAPEQASNVSNADARSDIYSLGCSLYFLLAGRPVYGGDSVVEKIFAHRGEDVPSILEVRPDVPAAVDRLLRRMIAKQPRDRYQSMQDVVAAIEKLIQSGLLDASVTMPSTRDVTTHDGLRLPEPVDIPTTVDLAQRKAIGSLEKFIDGCGGPDHFISQDEEHEIFRKGGALELGLDDIEAALSHRCASRGWTRQKTLERQLATLLETAVNNDGAIDQQEFKEIVDFAVKRKMPRRAADDHCTLVIYENKLPVREGLFNKWFALKLRRLNLE
jgi:serine/threonine protein kinase